MAEILNQIKAEERGIDLSLFKAKLARGKRSIILTL